MEWLPHKAVDAINNDQSFAVSFIPCPSITEPLNPLSGVHLLFFIRQSISTHALFADGISPPY